MIKDLEQYIKGLIAKDELWRFYKSSEWVRLKKEVLKENHYECAECRKAGIITRYDVAEDGSREVHRGA